MTASALPVETPAPPRQPARVSILTALDLGPDIAAMEGKELRLQLTTYAPGAKGTPHSHAGKVEVVYVMSGAIVEHCRDGTEKLHRPGDAFTANKDTFHYFETQGTEPAQLLVAMITDKAP
jgi:quercetin dioxygenase-like cupin family protein